MTLPHTRRVTGCIQLLSRLPKLANSYWHLKVFSSVADVEVEVLTLAGIVADVPVAVESWLIAGLGRARRRRKEERNREGTIKVGILIFYDDQ